MTNVTQEKIKTLFNLFLVTYKNDLHPEVAAQFAVEGVLNMYKTQMQYIDLLLDEEIEDVQKAIKH